MEDTRSQKLCLVPPHLGLSLFSRSLSCSFYSLLPISFSPLRCSHLSSPLSSIGFIFSSLNFWFGVFRHSLLLIFFPFFSLIPWLLLIFQGLADPSSPSVLLDPALQKFSTLSILTCRKLGFQLLPLILPVPRWFLLLKAMLPLG